jgi:hypothetical protein
MGRGLQLRRIAEKDSERLDQFPATRLSSEIFIIALWLDWGYFGANSASSGR